MIYDFYRKIKPGLVVAVVNTYTNKRIICEVERSTKRYFFLYEIPEHRFLQNTLCNDTMGACDPFLKVVPAEVFDLLPAWSIYTLPNGDVSAEIPAKMSNEQLKQLLSAFEVKIENGAFIIKSK